MNTAPYTDNQHFFDTAVAHMLQQNEKCVDGEVGDFCLYRHETSDGHTLACGIGGCIPDELYSPDFDEGVGQSVSTLIHNYAQISDLFQYINIHLLEAIQLAHDECDPQHWPGALSRVAEDFNLDTTVLDREAKRK